MYLSVYAGYEAVLVDGSGVVQRALMTQFREANDGSDGVARQRLENRSELPVVRSNREPVRVVAEICQSAQNCLWEAKHRDAIRLALTDALLHPVDRFRGVLAEQWRLAGGNSHRSRI